MWKRRRVWLGLGASLALTAVTFFVPAVHWRLIGWYKGEALYRDRPTGYWGKTLGWLALPDGTTVDYFNEFGAAVDAQREMEGDPEAVPVLTELLRSTNPRMREVAVTLLRSIGPPAKSAVPELLRAMEECEPGFRYIFTQALLAIDPEAARQAGAE